jgi:hypothetical protein
MKLLLALAFQLTSFLPYVYGICESLRRIKERRKRVDRRKKKR